MGVAGTGRVGGDDLAAAVRRVVCPLALRAVVVPDVVAVPLVKLETPASSKKSPESYPIN